MTAVPTTIVPQLGKLIALLSSDSDGEALGAARAIKRLLESNGRDFHDLARSICPPDTDDDWRRHARFCNRHRAQLTAREIDFIVQLARWNGKPTSKQLAWLDNIVQRIQSKISEATNARP